MFGMFFTIGGLFAGSSDGGGELVSRKKKHNVPHPHGACPEVYVCTCICARVTVLC